MEIIVPAYNSPPSIATKHEAMIGDAMLRTARLEGWIPKLPSAGDSAGTVASRVIDQQVEPAILRAIAKAQRPLTITEIAIRSGEDRDAVSYAVHRMVARNKLSRVKTPSRVRWGLLKEPEVPVTAAQPQAQASAYRAYQRGSSEVVLP